jgi:hypothetical protein
VRKGSTPHTMKGFDLKANCVILLRPMIPDKSEKMHTYCRKMSFPLLKKPFCHFNNDVF